MPTPEPEKRVKRPRLRLPFEKRKQDAGSWTYDHRIGLCVTLIAYLVLMIAFEMLLLGMLRYFVQLMREGASFLLVLHQTVGGTLVACMLCFIVYLPMRRISRAFSRDDRWI